jgi:hypothetical protein
LLRLNQFPDHAGLQTMLSTAGLMAVAEETVPGLGGQLKVFAIAKQ